ncbi:hypothetical protein P8452_38366 [Trifolium repens]|nr:hypothetical protein P8452_38366 [Trifolium repens]
MKSLRSHSSTTTWAAPVLDWALSPTRLEQCKTIIRAPIPFEDSNGQRYQAYRNGRHQNDEHLRLIMAFQPFFGNQLMAI